MRMSQETSATNSAVVSFTNILQDKMSKVWKRMNEQRKIDTETEWKGKRMKGIKNVFLFWVDMSSR